MYKCNKVHFVVLLNVVSAESQVPQHTNMLFWFDELKIEGVPMFIGIKCPSLQ